MQTPYTKPKLGKRSAPDGVANQTMAKMQKLVQPTTTTECFFLTKLPQELRDQIYDYVAMADAKIGAHVTLKEDSDVELYAYSRKGLGHTCRQIRLEYSLRLVPRIKSLVTEFQTTPASKVKSIRDPGPRKMGFRERLAFFSNAGPPVPALDHSAQSHYLQIAERKVVGGVYVQEDISYTMRIRFSGVDDMGLRFSNLIVTFASSAPRDYTDKYPLDPTRNEEALWTAKGRIHTIVEAAITLRKLIQCSNRPENDPWRELFWDFGILFPWRVVSKTDGTHEGNFRKMYRGRSREDHWWKTFDNRFCYPELTERIIEEP